MKYTDIQWRVAAIPTMMNEIQKEFLFNCARKKKILVEIGTWKGGTAAILSCASPRGKVFTIDNYSYDGAEKATIEEVQENLKKTRKRNVQIIVETSHNASKNWNSPIDFLFIDGDHSYEAVKQDIEDWLPHVVQGGSIVFDDYESMPEVNMVVNEMIENGILELLDRDKTVGRTALTRKI